MSWAIEHGSQPSQPAPPRDQEPSDADRVLLNAIESVLEKVAGVEGQEGAQALVERSTALRDTILAWQRSEPGAGERDGIASKVLGLHVALSRLTRGEPR